MYILTKSGCAHWFMGYFFLSFFFFFFFFFFFYFFFFFFFFFYIFFFFFFFFFLFFFTIFVQGAMVHLSGFYACWDHQVFALLYYRLFLNNGTCLLPPSF